MAPPRTSVPAVVLVMPPVPVRIARTEPACREVSWATSRVPPVSVPPLTATLLRMVFPLRSSVPPVRVARPEPSAVALPRVTVPPAMAVPPW